MMISRRQGLSAGLGALAVMNLSGGRPEQFTLVVTQMPWRANDADRIGAELATAGGLRRATPVVALLPPAYGRVDEDMPAVLARDRGVYLAGVMNGTSFLFSPDGERLLRGDGVAATSFARVGVAHQGEVEGADIVLRSLFGIANGSGRQPAPCVAVTMPDALDLGEVAADVCTNAHVLDWTGALIRAEKRTLVTRVDGAHRIF